MRKDLSGPKRLKGRRNSGVSEAIGTVLMLGISISLAGFVALWANSIEEGEEGIYSDIWATVQGTDLILTHRGGDILDGSNTMIIITDGTHGEVHRDSYYTLSGTNDKSWSASEGLSIDLSGVDDSFDLVITSILNSGKPVVILKNSMAKTAIASGLPDLAVTQVTFLRSDGVSITKLNDYGTYRIRVEVTNFGSDMTSVYFSDEGNHLVENLRLYDRMDDLLFTALTIEHYDLDLDYGGTDGHYVPDGHANFGIMETGDRMEFEFNWTATSVLPRTLGLHSLNVKIVPHYQGEIDYRNNYVERAFTVDKLITPVPIFGPDPGLYDISFSNEAPNSGEEVTVTVIIQNSGDQSILPEHGVHLIVSTWQPKVNVSISTVSYDWRVDSMANYGKWKSEVPSESLNYDIEFPTCIVPNITLLPGAYFFYYFTLEARVDVPGGEQWVYAAIDVYENAGHLEGIAIENGDDNGDNFALGNIQVLPRIMIVDDDSSSSGSSGDMTSSVIEALVGSGVTVDTIFVPQTVEDDGLDRDAPAFSYVQFDNPAPALEDYDIVIWVTGYDEDPLTNNPNASEYRGNIQEIMEYLDARKYFLLIGESPLEGLSINFNGGDPLSDSGIGSLSEYQAASDFVYKYLGISRLVNDQDINSTDTTLYGIDNGAGGLTPKEPDDSLFEIILDDQIAGNGLSQFYLPRDIFIPGGVGFEPAQGVLTYFSEFPLDGTDYVNTIRSYSAPLGNYSLQYKCALIGFDVKQITYLNEKIDLIAGFLRWYDWQINVGRDLAITKMELSIMKEVEQSPGVFTWISDPIDDDNLPKYLDTILIEATVRNNGHAPESTSVMFYVTGPNGIELPVATGIPDPTNNGTTEPYSNPKDISGLAGNGGEEYVYKYWLAVGVGTYAFRVVVDPYHLMSEISEDNNDITYSTSTITSFVTQNNILVVDDDFSSDNFVVGPPTNTVKAGKTYTYSNGEPSEIISDVLDDLEYDYEVHTVLNSYDGVDWTYDSGLSILDLKRYNSILWVTGSSGQRDLNRPEALTVSDMYGITKYLDGVYDEAEYLDVDHHENLMFIGEGFYDELIYFNSTVFDVEGSRDLADFVTDYLGLDPAGATSAGTGDNLFGLREGDIISDVFMGVDYWPVHFNANFEYTGLPLPAQLESEGRELIPGLYFVVDDDEYYPVTTQFHMMNGSTDNYFHTIVHSFDMTTMKRSSVETALYETLYLSMHWFGTPEDQSEILSRNCLMSFDNDNPVLGNSYLIELEIANLGGVAGGGTVRFTDGNTLVKSENIYLDPDTTTTLEAIWTPLYAGDRTLVAWIDRYDDYDEVFDIINNAPFKEKEIFFFWDDMENGSENWGHESTEIMINGEGKLDYMDEPTYVNIENEWLTMDGFYLNHDIENPHIQAQYKSSPNSYFMHESSGSIKKAVDVALVIDSSGSMGEDYDDNDPDNVRKSAARNFIDNMYDEDQVAVFDFDSSVNMVMGLTSEKTDAKSSIGEIDSSGSTALYDAGIDALRYMGANARSENQVVRAVVILTDGEDTASTNRLSDFWAVRDQYDDSPSTEEKIFVFTIRLVDGDENVLRSMCTQPWDEGPYYFYANDAEDLNKIYETIRSIIQDLSQAATRGLEDETRAARGVTIFDESFDGFTSIADLNVAGWATTGDPDPSKTAFNSTPISIELEYRDDLETPVIDLSLYQEAYLEFNWRSAADDTAGANGIPERGDRLWVDIYTSTAGGTWVPDYYLVNNNCFSTPWTRERIQLPDEAIWNGFQIRFRASTSSSDPIFDAYYLDDVKVIEGDFGSGSLGVQNYNRWDDGVSEARDKYIETKTIDLRYVDEAELSFEHKYNMKIGSNGGVIMIGTSDFVGGPFTYKYSQPDQPYTGNILISAWETTLDDHGTPMKWCFNGISSSGTMDWDKITVDLTEFSGKYVRVKFQYLFNQGGTGYGWIIDDVHVTITSDRVDSSKYLTDDAWKLIKASTPGIESHSGSHSWYAGDPAYSGGDLKDGVDNSLYTRNIDLTNARSATLSAYFRFNLDQTPGRPPDGFRVEVSSDGGNTWMAINLGVRSSWSVSGVLNDASDGIMDGKSFSGIDAGNNWVEAGSLTRLITNLNGFTGNVITIRFRVVTDTDPDHFDATEAATFRGFYVDDVIVYGESLESSRSDMEMPPMVDMEGPSNEEVSPSSAVLRTGKESIDTWMFLPLTILGIISLMWVRRNAD